MTIQELINRIQTTLHNDDLSEIDRDIALSDIRELYLAVKGKREEPFVQKISPAKQEPKSEPLPEVVFTAPATIVEEKREPEESKPVIATSIIEPVIQKQPEPEVKQPDPEVVPPALVQPVISLEAEPKKEPVINATSSLNEGFAEDDLSLNKRLSSSQRPALNDHASRKDLKSMIDLNKKFVLTNELFKGDSAAFAEAIDRINAAPTIEAAFEYIKTDLLPVYRWSGDSQSTRLFDKLVRQKFGV